MGGSWEDHGSTMGGWIMGGLWEDHGWVLEFK
jgi:hypothetical protein